VKVAFEAQVISNNIKSLRSLDKEARITLEYLATDNELVSNINSLHKADQTIYVVLMDKEDG